MNVSIGSMSTKVLGIAKSNAAATAEYCPPPDPLLVGTTAEVAAIPTKMHLEFLNASSEDSYTFTLIDDISDISQTINNISVDLTNQFSKNSFTETINLALRSAQTRYYNYRFYPNDQFQYLVN